MYAESGSKADLKRPNAEVERRLSNWRNEYKRMNVIVFGKTPSRFYGFKSDRVAYYSTADVSTHNNVTFCYTIHQERY